MTFTRDFKPTSTANLSLIDNRCFPIVPKLACQHLGLPITGSRKAITLLGGLTSFGGAGNNYSLHVGCSNPLDEGLTDSI